MSGLTRSIALWWYNHTYDPKWRWVYMIVMHSFPQEISCTLSWCIHINLQFRFMTSTSWWRISHSATVPLATWMPTWKSPHCEAPDSWTGISLAPAQDLCGISIGDFALSGSSITSICRNLHSAMSATGHLNVYLKNSLHRDALYVFLPSPAHVMHRLLHSKEMNYLLTMKSLQCNSTTGTLCPAWRGMTRHSELTDLVMSCTRRSL